MRIEVRHGNVDDALRKLKKKMFDDGTIRTLMDRRYYEKPSEKRQKRKKEAIRRRMKEESKAKARMEKLRKGR